MVMVQLKGTLEDAVAILHAAAFSSSTSIQDVARRVVARELAFTDPRPPVSDIRKDGRIKDVRPWRLLIRR